MSDQGRNDSLLSPFRVLDLTDEKGFLCGKILGDLGADVIKVEPPRGDPARNIGPFYRDIPDPERSLFWFAFNNNKRGITLNLEASDGQEIFKRLVKTADFVIESFPPGHMDRLGLGYTALSEINPRIILTSITPFGQNGPYRDYKASDIVLMAMGGYIYLTGDRDRPPVRISFPQAYLHAGAHAAEGTMIAHYYREITGEGQWVDVSAQESVSETPMSAVWHWDAYEENLQRAGSSAMGLIKGGMQTIVWECKDGYVNFLILGGVRGAHTNRAIVKWMDSEGMAPNFLKEKDWENFGERFDLTTVGQAELDQISEVVAKFFLRHTVSELYEEAIKGRFLLDPVANAKDTIEDPQLQARDFWQEVEHPELGTAITYPGRFIKLSESPCQIWCRAPLIGEHNQEIYGEELSFSKEKLILLKQAGVI